MLKTVFEYKDYRAYLKAVLGGEGARTGLKAKACRFLGCHSTYLSQVLNGRVHLSLEHGEGVNKLLNHGDQESRFFILLLLKERAGSAALRERFAKEIGGVLEQRSSLKNRMPNATTISSVEQETFYRDWIYSALHVLASLPNYRTVAQLASGVGITEEKAADAIRLLLQLGLLSENKRGLEIGSRHIHLPSDSHLATRHHTNWRYHSIQSLLKPSAEDLHYSGAVSLSRSAAKQIRKSLIENFDSNMKLMRDSKEEEAYVYNFDFYRLDRPANPVGR